MPKSKTTTLTFMDGVKIFNSAKHRTYARGALRLAKRSGFAEQVEAMENAASEILSAFYTATVQIPEDRDAAEMHYREND